MLYSATAITVALLGLCAVTSATPTPKTVRILWEEPLSGANELASPPESLRPLDQVTFEFTGDESSVMNFFNKKSYDECNLNQARLLSPTGPYTYRLLASGWQYFGSGVDDQCLKGRRVAVHVQQYGVNVTDGDSLHQAVQAAQAAALPPKPQTSNSTLAKPAINSTAVEWTRPNVLRETPQTLYVTAGSAVLFKYTQGHSIVMLRSVDDFSSCEIDNGRTLYSGAGPYRLRFNNAGTYLLVCGVGDHCVMGQKLMVVVRAQGPTSSLPSSRLSSPPAAPARPELAATPPMPPASLTEGARQRLPEKENKPKSIVWAVPANNQPEYPPVSLAVGESLGFRYTMGHNLYLFNDMQAYITCNFAKAKLLEGDEGPYTWRSFSAGVYYFGCGVGSHCQKGQKIRVEVQ